MPAADGTTSPLPLELQPVLVHLSLPQALLAPSRNGSDLETHGPTVARVCTDVDSQLQDAELCSDAEIRATADEWPTLQVFPPKLHLLGTFYE
jgi:hypothetical protein